jgi:hypothetical protein
MMMRFFIGSVLGFLPRSPPFVAFALNPLFYRPYAEEKPHSDARDKKHGGNMLDDAHCAADVSQAVRVCQTARVYKTARL